MSRPCDWSARASVRTTGHTWIPSKADFPAVSFSCSDALNADEPTILDGIFEILTHIRLGIDDPYPVVRVEGYGEEDGVLSESANIFAPPLKGHTGSGSPRRKTRLSLPESTKIQLVLIPHGGIRTFCGCTERGSHAVAFSCESCHEIDKDSLRPGLVSGRAEWTPTRRTTPCPDYSASNNYPSW